MRQAPAAPERVDRELRRPEARETQRARWDGAVEHRLRALRQLAREDRGLGLAVEDLAADTLARLRRSGDGLERVQPSRTLVSRVARTEASATVPTRAPAASVRRVARATRRRSRASSRSWLV